MKEEVIERASCSYENKSQRFIYKKKRNFDLQYSQLYATRYNLMKPKLMNAAKKRWGSDVAIRALADIIPHEDCVIIGTLFRKMELQPGILKEICQEENVLPLPVTEKYVGDDDTLIMEEQQQRIQLIGDINISVAITGTGVAVYGCEKAGKFYVKEICYASIPRHKKLSIDTSLQEGQDRYVLLLSGLGIGSKKENLLSLQLLVDLIIGQICDSEDQKLFSKICRLIIAGNSLSKDTQDKETEKTAKYLSRNTDAKSLNAIKSFDEMLVQLGSCVSVDIMPGENDPTNQFLPQQPLHKCMFPNSVSYSTVQSVTNPYQADIGGLRFLGTSGQNVSNIYQFSGFDDRLGPLEATLKAAHISPTCPDTLSCYPYYDEDPFILEECPDVYFAGNQPEFQSRHIKSEDGHTILLLLIPSFETTNTAVLVNLRNLSCQPLKIDTGLS